MHVRHSIVSVMILAIYLDVTLRLQKSANFGHIDVQRTCLHCKELEVCDFDEI